jgi:hypothetical protein
LRKNEKKLRTISLAVANWPSILKGRIVADVLRPSSRIGRIRFKVETLNEDLYISGGGLVGVGRWVFGGPGRHDHRE